MFRKNTAGQYIHFQGVDSSTGGIKSGVSWTMRVCLDGTFAAKQAGTTTPTAPVIMESDIKKFAEAAGYTPEEYRAELVKRGIKIKKG